MTSKFQIRKPSYSKHPDYDDEYVLPKTKYGIPVTAEKFWNNNFLRDGMDAEDLRGDKWWVKQEEEREKQLAAKKPKSKEPRAPRELTQAEKDDYANWSRKFEDEEVAAIAAKMSDGLRDAYR